MSNPTSTVIPNYLIRVLTTLVYHGKNKADCSQVYWWESTQETGIHIFKFNFQVAHASSNSSLPPKLLGSLPQPLEV